MLVKAKVSGFGEEQRMQFFATRILPHSFKEENRELLKRLVVYSKIPDYAGESGGC